jgi:hypothetical protein
MKINIFSKVSVGAFSWGFIAIFTICIFVGPVELSYNPKKLPVSIIIMMLDMIPAAFGICFLCSDKELQRKYKKFIENDKERYLLLKLCVGLPLILILASMYRAYVHAWTGVYPGGQ